jgi:hypothetical protein
MRRGSYRGIATEADVHSGKLDREQYKKLTETVLAAYPNLELIAVKSSF